MSTSPARLLRSPLANRRANGSTLLLRSLACQSGLRRCRHASTTSAASAMLLCACTSALDHPPALDCCCAALVAGLRGRIIYGRCSTRSSCGGCTSAQLTTLTAAHTRSWLVLCMKQRGLTRDRRPPARGGPAAPPSVHRFGHSERLDPSVLLFAQRRRPRSTLLVHGCIIFCLYFMCALGATNRRSTPRTPQLGKWPSNHHNKSFLPSSGLFINMNIYK